ncbi:MAG: hypothetical protein U1A78_16805 [Polyangia bacterium]
MTTTDLRIETLRTEWRKKPVADRLALLRDPWGDENQLRTWYSLEVDESWLGRWRSWARRQPISKMVSGRTLYHRHRLETFWQQERLLPVELAALRLGTTPASLRAAIQAIQDQGKGVRPPYLDPSSEQLVDEVLIKEFSSLFESLRFFTFSDYNSYCKKIHELAQAELGVTMEAARCVTAQRLGEEDYAHDLDLLDLQPMGLAYQVWLELGKPMNLKPDACSTWFYVQHEEALRTQVFAGVLPEVSKKLRDEVAKRPEAAH